MDMPSTRELLTFEKHCLKYLIFSSIDHCWFGRPNFNNDLVNSAIGSSGARMSICILLFYVVEIIHPYPKISYSLANLC